MESCMCVWVSNVGYPWKKDIKEVHRFDDGGRICRFKDGLGGRN